MTSRGPKNTFTGRTRRRSTSWSVRVGDRCAQVVITAAGIGTIVAVTGVLAFLVWVVVPLFKDGQAQRLSVTPRTATAVPVLHLAVNESQSLGWELDAAGVLTTFSCADGSPISRRPLFDGVAPTAASFSSSGDSAAFGFEDGSVRTASFTFSTDHVMANALPESVRGLPSGRAVVHDSGVLTAGSPGEFRLRRLVATVDTATRLEPPSPVILLDHLHAESSETLCSLTADGRLRLSSIKSKKNLITRRVTTESRDAELPHRRRAGREPKRLLLYGLGEGVGVVWDDGTLDRIDTRDAGRAALAETVDLLGRPDLRVTAVAWLIGRNTFLVGDSSGRVRAWFPVKPSGSSVIDGINLVAAHELGEPTASVTALAASQRTRLAVVGYADGRVRVFHVTSERVVCDVDMVAGGPGSRSSSGAAVLNVVAAPKNDGFLALSDAGLARFRFDPGFPEVTVPALFAPVWYEGYERPEHVWQSTGGTDDFEPKLGLWPLVFGTVKATLYALIFAVPIALLAAIFTSEFLHPKVKSRIKPTIELMASLPSVVLGFLAALVIAPVAEAVVPAILTAIPAIPFLLALSACLWQLLPQSITLRFHSLRFIAMLVVLPTAIALSWLAGQSVERLLFSGNIKVWLASRTGSSVGGWMILTLPIATIVVAAATARWILPRIRAATRTWSRYKCARLDLVTFLAGSATSLLLAWATAAFLEVAGLDPRGSYVDTFDQRNALIVGFVMGFAIIPVIYTIAEDALSTIPEHLRAASLGAGATPWQTTTRIVIPTAMSGLFSAVMVGLGRAVGETMIVLMAAGNTPVRDWNMFNGFRTLSANIAVELPEAVRDSAHYRTLFLAALTLFVMTFVLNTVAEAVRRRFRRRAQGL